MVTFTVVREKVVTLSEVDTVIEKVSFSSGMWSSIIATAMLADLSPGRITTSSLDIKVSFFIRYLLENKKNKLVLLFRN